MVTAGVTTETRNTMTESVNRNDPLIEALKALAWRLPEEDSLVVIEAIGRIINTPNAKKEQKP